MKKLIGLGLAAALGLSAWGEVLDTSVFTRACTFTLSGYQGASTLVDFPVLVRLDRTIPGFDPACCGANGAGLRFADEAGNLLAHEVDTWDVSGESCVWVRVPSLSGTNTKIRLYCGAADGAQLPAVSSRDVWSKYIMVAHGGANGIADASPKQLAVANGGGLTMPTGTGLVGDGFTKTDRNKIGLLVPNPITNNTLTDPTRFTLSGWYRNALTGTAILMAGVDAWGKTGFLVLCEGGGYMSVAVAAHQGPTNPKLGALQQYKWNHVAFSYVTSGELNTYFDGVNIFSKTGANVLTDIGLEYWTFGSYSGITNGGNFGGDMDELRIYDGIASADWIQAEHDSMRNPSFAAAVAMETLAQPVDVAVNSAARGSAGITVKGTIVTSAATATVALKWGLTPNLEGSPVALGSGSGTRAVEGTFPGTDATTRYYYAFEVTPAGGTAQTGAVYCTLDGVTGPVLDTTPFKRGCTFTLQGYTGASTLQNFPVLVRLSTAIPGFSYSDCAPNGADLRFVDESGKLLAHEIDTWNTAGESYVWVKVPSLMGQTTKIRLFFGVDDVVALPGVAPTDVWGAYVAVVHGGSTGVRNESPKGIVTSNGGGLVSSGASGVVGGGFAKAVVTRGSIGLQIQNPVKYGALTDTSRLTLSAWYRYMGSGTSILMSSKSAWAGTGFLTLCEQGTYMSVAVQSTHQGPSTDPKLGALVSGQWNHVAFSYVAAGQLNTYFDGLNIFSKADAKTLAHEDRENWAVGSYAETVNGGNFCGDMDEIRLYDGIASGDWIGAERASMVDPDFAKAVSVDNLVDVLPSEVSVSSVVRSDAGVAIAGTLTRLATGASQVTVTLKWGTTPAMTDGTVAVGTFTEASNFQCVFPGTDLTANYYYAFVMASDAGESTTSTDYRLFDPASAATWRPQTADDSWRSTAWLVDGAIRPFQQGWSVLFDGTETPYIDTLTNVAKLDLGTVTVTGDKDYTFTGDGELAAKRVVKTGSGTLTVDGRGFSGAVEWDVSGGTLKIGDSVKDGSGQSVLGTESTVNVHDGGTFDINSRSPQTLAAFNEPTRTLKVKIAGDGVDGKGALVNNDTTQIDGWGQHISRLELTGDATVGGPSRLDVRAFTGMGSTAPTNAVVTGPADATLRVIDNPRFNFCNTTVTQLGAIRAESNGKFFMETAGSMNLTRGLEIGEGGSIFLNGTGYTTPVTFLENTTGHFGGWSGVATAVQEGPLTVQNGATAIIDGGASQTMFKGAVTNNGTIVVKDLLNFYGPSIDGTGTIDQQGGGIRRQCADNLARVHHLGEEFFLNADSRQNLLRPIARRQIGHLRGTCHRAVGGHYARQAVGKDVGDEQPSMRLFQQLGAVLLQPDKLVERIERKGTHAAHRVQAALRQVLIHRLHHLRRAGAFPGNDGVEQLAFRIYQSAVHPEGGDGDALDLCGIHLRQNLAGTVRQLLQNAVGIPHMEIRVFRPRIRRVGAAGFSHQVAVLIRQNGAHVRGSAIKTKNIRHNSTHSLPQTAADSSLFHPSAPSHRIFSPSPPAAGAEKSRIQALHSLHLLRLVCKHHLIELHQAAFGIRAHLALLHLMRVLILLRQQSLRHGNHALSNSITLLCLQSRCRLRQHRAGNHIHLAPRKLTHQQRTRITQRIGIPPRAAQRHIPRIIHALLHGKTARQQSFFILHLLLQLLQLLLRQRIRIHTPIAEHLAKGIHHPHAGQHSRAVLLVAAAVDLLHQCGNLPQLTRRHIRAAVPCKHAVQACYFAAHRAQQVLHHVLLQVGHPVQRGIIKGERMRGKIIIEKNTLDISVLIR